MGSPLSASITQIGGPSELVAWLEDTATSDDDEHWDGCDRGDWLIWLAACDRIGVDQLVAAARRCAELARESLAERPPAPLLAALATARDSDDPDELADAARGCEELADSAPHSYRAAATGAVEHLARAAALVLRAREALLAASAQDEALRLREALERAAAVGVPPALLQRPASGPPRLRQGESDDPIQQELAYAVAAAARSVAESARALASPTRGRRGLEQAESTLADEVHRRLSDLRAGARQGRD